MLRKLPLSPLAAIFLLVLAVSFVFSLLPPSEIVDLGNGRDKLAHFLAFIAFSAFGFSVWPQRILFVCVLLPGYGLAMELVQGMSAHRMGDAMDLLADVCGVLVALSIRSIWQCLRPLLPGLPVFARACSILSTGRQRIAAGNPKEIVSG